MKHAKKWQPSNASTWLMCNGCPEMLQSFPNKASEFSDEGNNAHSLSEQFLKTGNWYSTDTEMIEYCKVYTDLVSNTPGEHHIEETIHSPSIHRGCFGTVDHWCYDSATKTLYVDDLKYGWGLVESWQQSTCYASGVFDKLNIPTQGVTIVMRIIQPRPYHPHGPIRSFKIKAEDLAFHVRPLHLAANDPNPCLNSGPWCKYCKAQTGCPANYRAALHAVDVINLPVGVEQLVPGVEIDILRTALETIKNRLTAREAEAEGILSSGGYVDGWILDTCAPRGKSTWTKTKPEIMALGQMMGVDLRNDNLITPIQAMKKGVPEVLVKANCRMPKPGRKLVKVDSTMAFAAFNGDK